MEEKIARLELENASLIERLKSAENQNNLLNKDMIECNMKIYELRDRIKHCEKEKFNYKTMKKDAKKMLFYTGIDKKKFKFIFDLIKTSVERKTKQLSLKDHLLIVLIKLKLGLMNTDIAYRFNIRPQRLSAIYRTWLPIVANKLSCFIIWPERQALRKFLPSCFRKYKNCCSIIDCTEIFIQRPLNLNARAQTWSNYKNTNTIKYLVSCTPAGAVSFLSEGWGGRVSDKEITINCGFLEYLQQGDLVLADRGFQLDQEFATHGAILKVPAFTKGKTQMSGADVDRSRQIANVRIHIERVIGRLRKFNILNTTIPISQVDLLDDALVAICGLVNLNKSVIPRYSLKKR